MKYVLVIMFLLKQIYNIKVMILFLMLASEMTKTVLEFDKKSSRILLKV